MRKYTPYLILLLILTIFIASSCSKQEGVQGAIEGTKGLVLSYLPNSPPSQIVVGKEDTSFGVTIQVRNAGAYSTGQNVEGEIFLGGYDRKIIDFKDDSQLIQGKFLEGRSISNPQGGLDLFEFHGNVKSSSLLADIYNFNLLATACYNYKTKSSPSVCINPNPYEEGIEKACTVQPIKLNSQGAPIAITNIEEEVLSEEIQFRITIKNVGNGRAIKEIYKDCDPFASKIDLRQNIDIVKLENGPKIGNEVLECRPVNNDKTIRLIEGEGFIICKLKKTDEMKKFKQGYTTPLLIPLTYTYMDTIQQPIQVVKRD